MATVNGLFAFTPTVGNALLLAAYNGFLYRYDGTTASVLLGNPVSATGQVTMIQAQDTVYGTSGTGPMFKTDGTTVFSFPITDADNIALTDVTDILFFMNRLWFCSGDFIYFTDPLAQGTTPTISQPSLRVRGGAGDTCARLIDYRDSFILIFKHSATGAGSVHALNVADNDPFNFTLSPLFQGLNIIAPRCIIRVGNSMSQDIMFLTSEGVRSINFTSLDRINSPSLPFSENVRTTFSTLAFANMAVAFSVVFNDEVLFNVPVNASTIPNLTLAYSLRTPKQTPQNGWSILDCIQASSAALMGFGGATPSLYIGSNNNGIISKAFTAQSTSIQFTEIGKRIDYGQPERDKVAFKLLVSSDAGATGGYTASLVFEDGREWVLGSAKTGGSGLVFPITFPIVFRQGGIAQNVFTCHYDTGANRIPRFKDARVILVSTGAPRILGFEFLSFLEPYRFIPLVQISETADTVFPPETAEPTPPVTNPPLPVVPPTPVGGVCTYALSSTSRQVTAALGTGTINLNTGAGCAWAVTSNRSWIHITSAVSGSGSTVISYSYDCNPNTSDRAGAIGVGGQSFALTQGAATIALSASSASYASTGGTGTVNVVIVGCVVWTAVSNDSWITVTSGSTGSGSGTVGYSVAANVGSQRVGTMTIAGITVTVTQHTSAIMWLVGDDLVLSDGAAVSTWTDSGELANNATQATAGARPVYHTNSVNGHAVVRFDGVDDHLSVASASNLITSAGSFLVIVVLKLTANITINFPAYRTTSNVQFNAGATTMGVYGVTNFVNLETISDITNGWHILTYRRNTNTWQLFLDGTQQGPNVTDSRSLGSPTTNYQLGSIGNELSQFYTGDVSEIMVFGTALDDSTMNAIHTSLKTKYGIT